jgi:phthalate 4,5-cis-dihydrodiol dehydrogenase
MAATETAPAQTRTLKVAVAGLGIAGTGALNNLARNPKTDLVAACDVRPQAVAAFQREFGGRGYTSYEELCQDPDVEAIWISTPNHLHAEHVITAAQHGKHTVIQKPMAISMQEAEAMVEASEKFGTRLLAGHSSALRPPFRAMRRIIDSGELGKLCAINVWSYTDWMLRPRMPQEVDLARGGGLVYRQGPHQVDAVRLLGGGMVRSVRAAVGDWLTERPCPGYYAAFIEFEDGTPATIVHNGYGYFMASELVPWGVDKPRTPYDHRVGFRNALRAGTLDEGVAKEALRFGGQTTDQTGDLALQDRERRMGNNEFIPADPGLFVVSCERGDVRQSRQGLYVYDDEGVHDAPISVPGVNYNNEIDEMYAAVTEDRPVYHDGRWGMATLEVCLAIMESARTRKEVFLTHQTPTFDLAHQRGGS